MLTLHSGLAILVLASALPAPAGAADLTSASFKSRGGNVSAGGTGALIGPTLSGGASVGQSEALGPSGASTSLTTQAGGFWPVVRGELPSLDLDGDGRQAFLDPDDDGDGLSDEVESDTGVFVSPSDTGTNPLVADSDGDGVPDGAEVALGSDPNDPDSVPPEIPALPLALGLGLAACLAAIARRRLERTARASS